MRQDRFLILILIAIGLLAVGAVALYFTRQGTQGYGAEDTPQGVVRNYLLALDKSDFERAYSYLGEGENKPDLEKFRADFLTGALDLGRVAVQIGEVQVEGENARVGLLVLHGGGGPFNEGYRESTNALLVQAADGSWKITHMPYPYWGWEWYQPIPK